ncbi:uncharacterized protein DSM5745_08323 [Aspergillus mulundensis]|uniref:Uncharacterized protein n=1 Tax=Aspergillus mulundensis TaxID=1810919 RepID=A0A3D8R9T0_9EURO|nr:hypothetical protein DSM5745_08323 [Aspergillus mulundensis]RDW70812.1 hypothetical protein DSM5745_08323 [Aspergillus mulundensis]
MAEIADTAASIITIWDLVSSAAKVQNTQKSWRHYLSELENLGHSVLGDIVAKSQEVRSLQIEVNEKKESFIDYINRSLTLVRNQALSILHQVLDPKQNGIRRRDRLKKFVSKGARYLQFLLKESDIKNLLTAVEHAKSTLQSAICIAHLHLAISKSLNQGAGKLEGNLDIEKTLFGIKDQMIEQSQALNDLHKAQKLDRTPVQIIRSTSVLSLPLTKTIENQDDALEPTIRGMALKSAEYLTLSTSHVSGGRMGDIADDNPQDCMIKISFNHGQEDNSLSSSNDEMFMFDTGRDNDAPGTDMGTVNLHPKADYGSGECAQFDTDESLRTPKMTPFTATSDFEYACKETIEFGQRSEIIIADGVDLERSKDPETGQYLFCVERLDIADCLQTFCLQEPCPPSQHCGHITLASLEEDPIQEQLPCKSPPEYGKHDEPNQRDSQLLIPLEGVEYSLTVFSKCGDQAECTHTLVEATNRSASRCASPVKLLALFKSLDSGTLKIDLGTEMLAQVPGDHDLDRADADTSEEIVREPENNDRSRMYEDASEEISQGPENNDDRRMDAHASAPFPQSPAPGDDECAFTMVRKVICGQLDEIPATVELRTLLHYVLLVHKYQLGGAPREQAKLWARSLSLKAREHFNSGDEGEGAIFWLWIFWKLGMQTSFKALSGAIQKHARGPIDQMVRGYQLSLSQQIIDQVEEKRISALSRIQDVVDSQIAIHRRAYEEVFTATLPTEPFGFTAQIGILQSSLMFGYLTLEKERWLCSGNTRTFEGVSFANVRDCVRSMVNLENWAIGTITLPDRMSRLLAGRLETEQALDAALHIEGTSGLLSPDPIERLVDLMAELEMGGWGVGLDSV